ncbi:MAG: hypothetical protein WCI95_06905 [bacterium]
MKRLTVLLIGIVLLDAASLAGSSVTQTQLYADSALGLTIAAGRLELPGNGIWSVEEPAKGSGISQVQLALPAEERANLYGLRAQKAELQRLIEQERYLLWHIHWVCLEYAATNSGIGPKSWADVHSNAVTHQIAESLTPAESNFFLIPATPITDRGGTPSPRQPLALQLHPVVDDGKYWVLYNDGQSERMMIDKTLCTKHGITIRPQRADGSDLPKTPPGTLTYSVSALVDPKAIATPVPLVLLNRETGEHLDCNWSYTGATAGPRSILSDWAQSRGVQWALLATHGDAPVLNYWLARGKTLYGADMTLPQEPNTPQQGESVDAFGVLGGRAAVRETLQLQPLRQTGNSTTGAAIPLDSIPGVEVRSHPFDEMLKSVSPGSLPMADNVPTDRAFVYLPKPKALIPLLDGGADFTFQGGSLAVANSAAYNLKARYVERLALTDKWMRDLLLKSGAVEEMAIFFPDLFFIDGTDITVLARIPSAPLLAPALSLLGLGGLTGTIQEKTNDAGSSFWVMDGDLLVISTSHSEAERVLALRKAKGVGSLGQSAELRYMLSQTPVRPETRAYCYLSDPFIRRLVGPEVKIGQLRRLVAKGEMESVTAAALLQRLDGQRGRPDTMSLTQKGYLDAMPTTAINCSLDEHLVASCPKYGSPASMRTLLEAPVTQVTPAEASAYNDYLTNYSRFWRQYFDPIAFRLDDGLDGELQLTTFILPLIDNSIYNSLKEGLRHREDRIPLRLPDLTPKPLALLSANLSEEAWTKITREIFSDLLHRFTTLDPTAFDKIGPGIHLAIHDADPILTFGAGDVMGIFGSQTLGRGRSEMLFIPVAASLLTRPCQLIVELQEPDTLRRMMRAASSSPLGTRERGGEPTVRFYKLDGRDAWVCAVSLERIVNIRFGVEIQGDFLILSNLPWSQKPAFGPTRTAPLNTLALDIHPEAGVLQMPGLFTAACEQERAAAFQGLRYLYPLLACGADSPVEAEAQCRRLFGFAPEHPGSGRWLWEKGRLLSSIYGDQLHPRQPEYKAGARAFGILDGLDLLNLNLQFEDAGLRVLTRWKSTLPAAQTNLK